MNQEISLLILIEVKPNHRQKQIDAFNKIAPIVLKENGCLQYELYKGGQSPLSNHWHPEKIYDPYNSSWYIPEQTRCFACKEL